MAAADRTDARTKRDRSLTAAPSRAPRENADAARKDHDGLDDMSAAARARQFASEFTQEALPNVPDIPGYHLCWLSTTSPYDPIHKRMRIGYEPVKLSEVRDFPIAFQMTSGEFQGCVACNEMVLFKIRQDVYQAIMTQFHHDMPLSEEQAIKSNLESLMGKKDSQGRRLMNEDEDVGDGIKDLAKPVQRPAHFA